MTGGSGIRTHDGGFAIRCLSPLGHAAVPDVLLAPGLPNPGPTCRLPW